MGDASPHSGRGATLRGPICRIGRPSNEIRLIVGDHISQKGLQLGDRKGYLLKPGGTGLDMGLRDLECSPTQDKT
jgi:hypothetical protein